MSSVDWRQIKYDEVFAQESLGLQRRREAEPHCKVEDIEAVLKNLYIMQGADWEGRSDVVVISMAASVAAHEHFIAEWKAELRRN